MNLIHDPVGFRCECAKNTTASVAPVIDVITVMDIYEAKLGIDSRVDVCLVSLGYGCFGSVNDVEVLSWVDVVTWVSLIVGLTQGVFGVNNLLV
jgi:hypothetical protein